MNDRLNEVANYKEDELKRLNSIGVSSVFKMSLVVGSIGWYFGRACPDDHRFIDKRYLEGAVTMVLAPILYGVLGALVNAFMAWLYNLVAARLGGIEISFED